MILEWELQHQDRFYFQFDRTTKNFFNFLIYLKFKSISFAVKNFFELFFC